MKSLYLNSAALLSDDGRYRYWLTRTWDESRPRVCWVMLNPSKADHQTDDPTIRKCIGFAERWGCGGITVVNLFALRATDPAELYQAEEPVGALNDLHLAACAMRDRRVVCGWGAHGGLGDRNKAVLALLYSHGLQPECLGRTKEEHPRHPLYLGYEVKPQPYVILGREQK